MTDLVLISEPSPSVALLKLNRPEARNALNLELRVSIAQAIEKLADSPGVKCAILTGDERAFAAGADLRAIATASPAEMMQSGLHRVWDALARFPKPLITAVRGVALGAGCELAMNGDIIVAGQSTQFGQPEIKVGLMPGAGGVQRLIRLIGRARAMRMLLTGEAISGRTAFDWGLASDLVGDDEVLPTAVRYAEAIAALPVQAATQIKEVATLGADLPLDAALTLERKAFWLMFGTADQREGAAAFLEKRKPTFGKSNEHSDE